MFSVILINKSHVTVVDPDSSDSSRLYPNECYRSELTDPSVTSQSNSIPTKFLLSAPKEVYTSKSKIGHHM